MSETLRERLARNAAAKGIGVVPTSPAPEPTWAEDLIPDVDDEPYQRTEEDNEVDRLLNGFGIIEAYTKWCGKSKLSLGRGRHRTEGLMISCPNPAHPDKNPSAWINVEKGTWYCGGCCMGGDKYDLAAWHFGFDVPGYKRSQFPELRRKMAEDLGYVIKKTASGKEYVEPLTEPESEPISPPLTVVPATPAMMPVADLMLPESGPEIDWERVLRADTVWWQFMKAATHDTDIPDEFYFFLGGILVGSACGQDVVVMDRTPVKLNLFLLLLAQSGTGKSRSIRDLQRLLRRALPHDWDDPWSKGIHLAGTAASAEALIDSFAKVEVDPTTGKVLGQRPVRGLQVWPELSDFMAKSDRRGNPLLPALMELYDAYGDVSIRSRGHGTVTAADPFCMAITTTQIRSLSNLLSHGDADSGFVNRWVPVMGREVKRSPWGGTEFDIEPLVRPVQMQRVWSSSGRRLKLTDSGLAVFTEWFREEYEPAIAEDDSSLLARTDLTMKKFMGLLAANSQRTVVDEDTVNRALMLWPYLRFTYGTIGKALGGTVEHQCCEAILEALRDFPTHPTAAQLYERRLKRRFPDRSIMNKALYTLQAMGQITDIVVKSTAGTPTSVRYKLTTGLSL